MLLEPSWVTIYYHTKTGRSKIRLWYRSSEETKRRYRKAILENMTIAEVARLFMPRGGVFDPGKGDRIVFSFNVVTKPNVESPYHDKNVTVSSCGSICPPLGLGFILKALELTDRMDEVLRRRNLYAFTIC